MKSFYDFFGSNTDRINKELKSIATEANNAANANNALTATLRDIVVKERELEELHKKHDSYWPRPCGTWISCAGVFTPHRTNTRKEIESKKVEINKEKDKLLPKPESTQPTTGAKP